MIEEMSLEDRIMEAVAAGDWETSRALKHELLNEQRRASQPDHAPVPALVAESEQETDDALRQQIADAMASGDWDTSRRLKHAYNDRLRARSGTGRA